jgi:hypothetical protein
MAIFGDDKEEERLKVGEGNRSGSPFTAAHEARKNTAESLWDSVEEARERLDKLHLEREEEANALNREYDRLCAKVRDSIKELETFEVEKLGMKK